MLNKSWAFVVVFLIPILFYLSFLTLGNALTNNTLQTEQLIKSNNYLTYQNATFSFKVDYPSTWTVAENNPDLVLRVKDVVVNFFSPPKDFSDVFSENLNVGVSKIDETESTSLDDLQVTIIPALKLVFGVHDSMVSQDISLDGNPAKKITYSYKLFDKMVKNTQVYSFKSGNLYVINHICEAHTCSSYLPVFDKMIGSFEFL
jgi:hypothetical protein